MEQTTDGPGATGQWFTASDGHRWWFDSGSVALDFAYTGAMGEAGRWESLHAASDLGGWLGARFAAVDGTASDRDLADGRVLREAIARIAQATSDGLPVPAEAVDTINLFAATPDIPPVLAGGNRQAGRSRARPGQALSTMAREAVGLFAPESADRIRECAADGCALVFADDSRSNNRRWCSMQRCGNRAKVRTHRSRAAG